MNSAARGVSSKGPSWVALCCVCDAFAMQLWTSFRQLLLVVASTRVQVPSGVLEYSQFDHVVAWHAVPCTVITKRIGQRHHINQRSRRLDPEVAEELVTQAKQSAPWMLAEKQREGV